MSELVHEDEHTENKSKRKQRGHGELIPSFSFYLAVTDLLTPAARSVAYIRAQSSTWRMAAKVSTGDGRCASMASAMSRGIAVNPSLPSRNAATATSLAAFNTIGRLRSASSALYARRRHGKSSHAGSRNSSGPQRARSRNGTGASHRSG